MAFIIRRAGPEDAAGITTVKTDTWPDEKTDVDRIRNALYNAGHHAFIALQNDWVVAFVDGFSTLSAAGVLRYEVDLLAVAPAFRKQGLAKKLVLAQMEEVTALNPAFFRALIHHENIGSQAVFRSCGFEMREGCSLFIASAQDGDPDVSDPGNCHLIPVETMTYRGFWLEEASAPQHFSRARQFSKEKGYEMVGSVIPDKSETLQKMALENGYQSMGNYYWWVKGI